MRRSEADANRGLVAALRGVAGVPASKRWAPDYFEHNSDAEEQRAARRYVRRVLRSPLSDTTAVDPYNCQLGRLRVLSR
jgi:hypothetical protein